MNSQYTQTTTWKKAALKVFRFPHYTASKLNPRSWILLWIYILHMDLEEIGRLARLERWIFADLQNAEVQKVEKLEFWEDSYCQILWLL